MFKLSENINSDNVFLINRSQLEGRLDPNTYHKERLSQIQKIKNSNSEIQKLKYAVDFNKVITSEIKQTDIYVGLENIESNTGEYVPTTDKESISSAVIFKKGDVLFPKLRPNLNKVYFAQFNGICSTEFHILNAKEIDNRYLTYFLRSDLVVNQTKRLMSGNTLPRLQTEDIYNLLIPIKSEETQKAIIDLMDKAYEQKQQKENQAKKLLAGIDEYLLNELGITLPEKDNSLGNRIFKTSFQKVTGNRFDPKLYDTHSQKLFQSIENAKYRKVLLKHLIIQSFSGDWGLDENAEVNEQDYRLCMVIRATEFDNDFNLNIENSRAKYRKIKTDKLNKLDIQPHDLLIEKSGGSPDQPVGRISFLTKELVNNNNLCYSNFIHKIRVDTERIYPEYLFCYLKTIHNIKVTEIMQSQTNGIRNLIMREYLNQSIVLPEDIEKQKEIAGQANNMRYEAQRLQQEAKQELENARKEVEKMILNEEKK